jgi:prepilin-type N-terminal cleavage/methylation domain-containing protein
MTHTNDHAYERTTESGMTLVEMLAALTISSILIALMFEFFISMTTGYTQLRQTSEMQQEMRWGMQFVSDRLKLAGNGVPATSGFKVLENTDGAAGAPDSVSVLGSFRSLVITTDQSMGNEGSQVKVDDTSGIDIGDLAVISDGTFTDIFMVTGINGQHLWHDTALPWNDDNKLDHRYSLDSSVTIVTYFTFFVDTDAAGHQNLMVRTQAYPAQVLIGDIEDFQIRFQMKSGAWLTQTEDTFDIRVIEIYMRSRSPEPVPNYTDPVYGDGYKRVELKSVIIPKNIVII